MAKLVSGVYGDAMFSLALEENRIDALQNEITIMQEVLDENPEFAALLSHPEITGEKKLSMLHDVFGEELSESMRGFLHVLVKKRRIGEISSVLLYLKEKVMAYQKIGIVQVRTPMPLSSEQKKKIEKKLLESSRYETLSMDYQVEEKLLGGIVIRIGDRVLDNSIRTKLDALTRDLSKVKLSG